MPKIAKPPKLTGPQIDLLLEAFRAGGTRGIDRSYKPAQKLVELEYGSFEEQQLGGWRIRLTPAGSSRAAEETAREQENQRRFDDQLRSKGKGSAAS